MGLQAAKTLMCAIRVLSFESGGVAPVACLWAAHGGGGIAGRVIPGWTTMALSSCLFGSDFVKFITL